MYSFGKIFPELLNTLARYPVAQYFGQIPNYYALLIWNAYLDEKPSRTAGGEEQASVLFVILRPPKGLALNITRQGGAFGPSIHPSIRHCCFSGHPSGRPLCRCHESENGRRSATKGGSKAMGNWRFHFHHNIFHSQFCAVICHIYGVPKEC